MSSGITFTTQMYLRAKSVWGAAVNRRSKQQRRDDARSSSPFSKGRDPKPLGDILGGTADDMGWTVEIQQAKVIANWNVLVGETTAPHTEVRELRDGVLIVQCDSTAWATELRRIRAEVVSRIHAEYPDAGIQDLRFLAPGAPSWRHGARVVPGRGPRDTYG